MVCLSGQLFWAVGDAGCGEAFGMFGFGAQGDQGLLQAGDLAEPDLLTGLGDALAQIGLQFP